MLRGKRSRKKSHAQNFIDGKIIKLKSKQFRGKNLKAKNVYERNSGAFGEQFLEPKTNLLTLGAGSVTGKGESSSPPNDVAVSSSTSTGGGAPLTFAASLELSVSELSFSF